MTSVLVVGLGETGVRTARQLLDTPGVDRLTVGARTATRARAVAQALHDGAESHVLDDDLTLPDGIDAIAAAVPPEADVVLARAAVDRGIPYASVGDDPGAVRALLDLDADAHAKGIGILVGCGLAPGLSDVLVHHAGDLLDSVDEVHVARFGIAGPACAAVARRALREPNREWRDGEYVQDRHRGDELIWFPDPVDARECALVATGVELLVGSTPGAERVTARLGLPPARRLPAPGPILGRLRGGAASGFDATFGAMRAEVWGWRGTARDTVVYGVIERTAVAAGTVLGVAAAWLAGALPEVGDRVPGASGLGTAVKPVPFLAELARRGVKAAVFEGVAIA